LRLRVSPSEMERLLNAGRIEESIHFAVEPDAMLTYALELAESKQELSIRHLPREVTVILSTESVRKWAGTEQVGIYGAIDVGHGRLELILEKDFACLDGKEAGNDDTFANPKSVPIC
jgi:hypothetical protein